MKISKDKVVSYHFVLNDEQGNLLEKSDLEPFQYLHGYHTILPLIEDALEGKQVGDTVSITVSPEKGFGKHSLHLIKVLPRSFFPQASELKVGMRVYAEQQQDFVITITAIEGDNITVDANHPFAGKTVTFEITVLNVRDATEQEIQIKHINQ